MGNAVASMAAGLEGGAVLRLAARASRLSFDIRRNTSRYVPSGFKKADFGSVEISQVTSKFEES